MGATLPPLIAFKGLVTAPGLLLREPASCVVAENCLFETPGRVSKRNGFIRLFADTPQMFKVFSPFLEDTGLIFHLGGGGLPLAMWAGDGNTPYVPIVPIDGLDVNNTALENRMQTGQCQKNNYFTSDEGIRRVESNILTSFYGGMPRGQAPTTFNMEPFPTAANILNTAAGTMLPDNGAVAYRVTWHRLDNDGVELGGPPSSRLVVRNIASTSGYGAAPAAVVCYIPVPKEIGTSNTTIAVANGYFWRLWRSQIADLASNLPDDEMYLVAQKPLTATDVTNGVAEYLDDTTDDFLTGAPTLNTNQNKFPEGEEGLLQGTVNADEPPPRARALAYWADCMWYGDCYEAPQVTIQLLGTGTTGDALRVNDTITINGVTYTAKATPVLGSNEFKIHYAAVNDTGSIESNLEATARNLTEAVNRYASNTTVNAYYVSGGAAQPGSFQVITRRAQGTLNITSSRAAWSEPLTTGLTVAGESMPNVVMFSKKARADAMPTVNRLECGTAQNTVLKLQPYRDRLLIFTTLGIYQAVGSYYGDFSVIPFDLTYRVMGRELVALCDDKVYAWCREGIVECTEGGVRVISMPIEPTLNQYLEGLNVSTPFDSLLAMSKMAFSIAYRLKHRVMFWVPQQYNVSQYIGCGTWYCWDTRTECWSTGRLMGERAPGIIDDRSCGVVRVSDDRLVLGEIVIGGLGRMYQEDFSSFSDEDSAGVAQPVVLTNTMQYQVPEINRGLHWQQFVVHLDAGEFTARPTPTEVVMGFQTPQSSYGEITVTPAANATSIRVETPRSYRRANRIQVSIINNEAEYFGAVGIGFDVGSSSPWQQRT